MSKNYDWYIKADMSKYAGKWVAIIDQKPVITGTDAKKVYEEAKKKFPNKKPYLVKVPTHDTLIFNSKLKLELPERRCPGIAWQERHF